MEIRELIHEFGKTRPEANIIVGYGSEVKKQANDNGLEKQVDLILGVDDTILWHKLNHQRNPSDYKSKIGYKLLPLYENFGTKINYLSYLPFEGHMFKIGVVNTECLISDLIHWENFFLAGRFQKPIEIVKNSQKLDDAIKINRLNALKVALLTLEPSVSEEELFQRICSLSFIGDWRRIMHVETKDKVKNIVGGSFDELHEIYSSFNNDYCSLNQGNIDICHDKLIHELHTLPEQLKNKILNKIINGSVNKETLEHIKNIILKYFVNMNIRTSAAQPLKGFALNGFSKTMTYLNHKIAKK